MAAYIKSVATKNQPLESVSDFVLAAVDPNNPNAPDNLGIAVSQTFLDTKKVFLAVQEDKPPIDDPDVPGEPNLTGGWLIDL